MMDVLEAIEHAESDLANTLDELRMAKELVTALEADSKKIQIEIVGLKSYASRQGLTRTPAGFNAEVVPISADVDLTPAGGSEIAMMSRSDAVATVMADAPGPLDRAGIHEAFVDGGRFDSIDDISLTLSGLKRSGRVTKLGQGLWQLVAPSAAESR